jgi:hypothetical protein
MLRVQELPTRMSASVRHEAGWLQMIATDTSTQLADAPLYDGNSDIQSGFRLVGIVA